METFQTVNFETKDFSHFKEQIKIAKIEQFKICSILNKKFQNNVTVSVFTNSKLDLRKLENSKILFDKIEVLEVFNV